MYYRISEYRGIAMDFNSQEKLHRNVKNGKNTHRHSRREEHKRLKSWPKAFLGHEQTDLAGVGSSCRGLV